MSRSPLALAVLGLVAGLLAPCAAQLVEPAAAAAPTCNGQRATKVGSPGQTTLRGTRGRDVMVTNGSARVYGGPGNDLICVTRRTTATRVFDGPGNDVVEGRGAAGLISVDVSSGDDVVRGTPFDDLVEGAYRGPATSADVVYGGAGDDVVNWTNTHDHDRIELGPGDDRLTQLLRPRGVRVEVGAGAGTDRLRLIGPPSDYEVHLPARRLEGPDGRLMGLEGFERFDLADLGTYVYEHPVPSSRIRFVGTDGDEVVDMGHAYTDPTESDNYFAFDRSADVFLGAGEDVLAYRANDSGTTRGGPGDDRLTVSGSWGLVGVGDVAKSRFVVTNTEYPDYRARFVLADWEAVLTGYFGEVDLAGTAGPETLGVDDVPSGPVRVLGRGGDDVLVGGSDDDELRGGEGADRADGNGGTDTCVAETVIDCEGEAP